ncbi:MAG: insulinase family protein [Ktedonobacterales bacterium]|nr:insulinase family protein [Ktedonobacterales bacterium]
MAVPVQQQQFFTQTLPNGLQVLAQRMPDMESVAVAFYVRTGSRDEADPAIWGVSHFLEHMVFKGTAKRTGDDITLAFNHMGAEFNAYTSFEETVYHARVLADQLPNAIDLLADMMRPRLDGEDFARERDVILEEITRGEDQPTQVAARQFYQTYFTGTNLGHDVIGTRESIQNMTIEQMRAYFGRRYAADNIILAVAGNLEWPQVLELAQKSTADWGKGEVGRPADHFTPQPVTRLMHRDLQAQHILFGYPFPAQESKDYYAAIMASDILGDGSGSRLYWNITHKGLAEAAMSSFSPFNGLGMHFFYISAAPDAAQDVLNLVREELKSIEADGVHEDELARAKAKLIGHTVLDGESTMRRMMNLPNSWLIDGRLKTLEEDIADIEAVTVEDVNRVYQQWPSDGKTVLLTMGPRDDVK